MRPRETFGRLGNLCQRRFECAVFWRPGSQTLLDPVAQQVQPLYLVLGALAVTHHSCPGTASGAFSGPLGLHNERHCCASGALRAGCTPSDLRSPRFSTAGKTLEGLM